MASPKRAQTMARFAKVEYLIVLIIGMFIGSSFTSLYNNVTQNKSIPSKGAIRQLYETPIRNTSHVDDKGRPITKQQLLEPFVLPNFVGFSIATFLPGQTMMPAHEHETLYEIFYVIDGSGIFEVDGIKHEVSVGTFLLMAPHEKHGIWVPESKDTPLKVVVTGVVVGDRK